MRVTVVGTGYVGLVTGTCLSDMGNDVVCHDVDADKLARLDRGDMPIYEPGLEELVKRNTRDGRLRFTTDMASSLHKTEVCFIAVGTPADEDGSADRRHVMAASRAIGDHMEAPLVVAVKSTVPVGTCDMVRDAVSDKLSARGVDFEMSVVSNPEFLKEGKAIEDFMRPDRIVIGVDSESAAETMRTLYAPFVRNGHPLLEMDVRSSEMTKYASNVMLATRISLMNEIAQICDRVGADVMSVRKGMGTDKRIGPAFLYPGVGFGGSCFPKDVKALSRMAIEADCPGNVLDAVEKVNRYQKLLLANRLINHFGGKVHERRVAMWGIAFKPMTDDIREAPALAMIKRLTDAGATVCAYDPEAMDNARVALEDNPSVSFATDLYAAVDGADALVLATEWGVFRSPDFERIKSLMKQPLIFDGRNQYEPRQMRQRGFTYFCIGRPSA